MILLVLNKLQAIKKIFFLVKLNYKFTFCCAILLFYKVNEICYQHYWGRVKGFRI